MGAQVRPRLCRADPPASATALGRFRSPGSAQRFLATHAAVYNHFNIQRHRISRRTFRQFRAEDYVTAARARGEMALYTQYREVLPNIWAPVIVEASIHVGFALMAGAALSYLGLGTQPPAADWGVMVRAGQQAINQSVWPLIGPAVIISLAIIGFNLFGEGLRDRVERLRGAGDE